MQYYGIHIYILSLFVCVFLVFIIVVDSKVFFCHLQSESRIRIVRCISLNCEWVTWTSGNDISSTFNLWLCQNARTSIVHRFKWWRIFVFTLSHFVLLCLNVFFLVYGTVSWVYMYGSDGDVCVFSMLFSFAPRWWWHTGTGNFDQTPWPLLYTYICRVLNMCGKFLAWFMKISRISLTWCDQSNDY